MLSRIERADVMKEHAEILIVEDNEMNRDMLSRRLMRKGFEVLLAIDGEQAVSTALGELPDIVLMDMQMPVLSGVDATRAIRAGSLNTATPILAMTATAPPRVRQDIEQQLLGRNGAMRVLVGDTFRPNLQLTAQRVRDHDARMQGCVDVVRTLAGTTDHEKRNTTCGIVYARSRQRCE